MMSNLGLRPKPGTISQLKGRCGFNFHAHGRHGDYGEQTYCQQHWHWRDHLRWFDFILVYFCLSQKTHDFGSIGFGSLLVKQICLARKTQPPSGFNLMAGRN